MDSSMSPADMRAVMGGEDDGMNSWIWIIIFVLLIGGGGFGGFGNNGRNCASTEDVQNQFNFAALERQNNETVAAVHQAQYDTSSVVKDVAYTNLSNIKDAQAAIAALGYSQAQCCCDLRTEGLNNTQKILDAISGNRIADMQNQINQLQLQSALCGVVRYPTAITFNGGASPFCGGCGC